MSIDRILVEIEQYQTRYVVLTGGEPMIQKDIHELADRLAEADKHITIETAGTVPPESIACDLVSLSPKLGNSTPVNGTVPDGWIDRHEKLRLQPEVISKWIRNYNYQLKFVVRSGDDMFEIHDLLRPLSPLITPAKVLLMPEGIDSSTLKSRREMLIRICKSSGYRYCDRLQIELFGNTKGT